MRDIPGYEGLYAITSCGKVWSYENKRFLKPFLDKDGYKKILLCKNNKKKYFIHRLVALTYLPNPNNYPIINHKDENKQNNSLNNLEWCTAQYNTNYGTRNKKVSKKLSKKLMYIETNEIFDSVLEAAEKLNLRADSISKVCRGERTSLYGKHFKFI